VNFISLPQEERGIFDIKAAVEMQNNLQMADFTGKIHASALH
jgi:hypothetical protein